MMQSDELISVLTRQTEHIIAAVSDLKKLDRGVLTQRESELTWNILECVEHLALYGDFYIPQMERKVRSSTTTPDKEFKSGMLGGYFAKSMLPDEKVNRMKTFKDKNPLNAKLGVETIDRFLDQQRRMLKLLEQSRQKSLNSIRITTTISSLIRLKLGDALQFLINHNLRHLIQIERIQRAH